MLLLIFQLGPHRFALDTRQVIEVLPRVDARPLPQAPAGVTGVFSYHGTPVPLLDLAGFATGVASAPRMKTRIILVNYEDRAETHPLGLLAENATETIHRGEGDFEPAGVDVEAAPYLGPVTRDARGLIQRVELHELLPESARERLFREPIEAV